MDDIKFELNQDLINGNYSAIYLDKSQKIAKTFGSQVQSTMQFFQRKNNVVFCGINYVLQLLEAVIPLGEKITVKYLKEGSIINNCEPVLQITGNYSLFGYLEGVIDGIFARATSIATNAAKCLKAAGSKKVICMFDRADYFLNQELDGYAAMVGGLDVQVTKKNYAYHSGEPVGTFPHALIQLFDGNLIEALEHYVKVFPNDNLTALVDYNNDVISDTLQCLKHFKKKLKAVRLDTSKSLSDAYFSNRSNKPKGVVPELVKALRNKLNKNGGEHVKIIVSSGFDKDKILEFENQSTPVDVYGVGEALIKLNTPFTADLVLRNNKHQAKFGRKYVENCRLKTKILFGKRS